MNQMIDSPTSDAHEIHQQMLEPMNEWVRVNENDKQNLM